MIYKCNKCKGLLYTDDLQFTNDYMCNCNKQYYSTAVGWICPRCGKAHSPYSIMCDCFPYEKFSSGITFPLEA